jgi:cell division protein FtsN
MSRRPSQARRGSQPLPAWLWLLAGVVLGLLLSGLVLFRDFGSGDQPRPNPAAAAPAELEAPVAQDDPRERRPRYDFYTILPEQEVVVPREELARQATQTDPAGTETAGGQRMLLQAGSFREGRDAEALKARLALLGHVAQVVPVTIDGSTWHRVRLGPYDGARQVEEVRRQLAANGVDSIALRESGG